MTIERSAPTQNVNHGMVAPKPERPEGAHISAPVRAKLADIDPKIAAEVRRVADNT